MEQKSIKQAKLHCKYRRRVNQPNHVPWLNVNGLWLERAGFGIGQQVEIAIENRKLTIIAL
jgi:toxic protein SymE